METNTATAKTEAKVVNALGDFVCDLNKIDGRLHFVGIGGIGMSALARLLLSRGMSVSGSDKQGNPITDQLAGLGAQIFVGHEATNVAGASGIVVSTAITPDNPELAWAKANKLPVFHRSQILAALAQDKTLIAISGTHGKTTTTAMIAKMLMDADLDPSLVLGGVFPILKSNCRAGGSEYFVAEADESDGTHVSLHSQIAVITNIEADHMENYPSGMKQILDTMKQFASQANAVVLCLDDPGCQAILPELISKVIGYGAKTSETAKSKAKYQFEDMPVSGQSVGNSTVKIYQDGKPLGTINLSVPGKHNKYNATAAAATGMELGIDFQTIAKSLSIYGGVDRRFQIIGQAKDVLIVDDYAHHPTEIVAALEGARQYIAGGKFAARRLVAVFQPHQPGRLRDLWAEFCQAFKSCDLLLVADVYIARGAGIAGIDSKRFTEEVQHSNCIYLPGKTATLPSQIKNLLQPHDLVMTIGAGDITEVGPALLQLLQ